jgi:hypothetical protein
MCIMFNDTGAILLVVVIFIITFDGSFEYWSTDALLFMCTLVGMYLKYAPIKILRKNLWPHVSTNNFYYKQRRDRFFEEVP